jgi:hypothetical protein
MSEHASLSNMRPASEKWARGFGGAAFFCTGTLLLASLLPAAAQVSRPAAPAGQTGCASSPGLPNAAQQGGPSTAQPAEDLSQRLARADGIICPPADVDPEMKAPTPDAGNTPIIPPPGSPGGDPTIRPK